MREESRKIVSRAFFRGGRAGILPDFSAQPLSQVRNIVRNPGIPRQIMKYRRKGVSSPKERILARISRPSSDVFCVCVRTSRYTHTLDG
jgi:hypothetical protein